MPLKTDKKSLMALAVLAAVVIGGAKIVTSGQSADDVPDYRAPLPNATTPAIDQLGEKRERSVDPFYTEPAEVTEWEHHALVLQGENLLPIREAFATESLTIFNLEPGYMPVNPMGRIDENNACYQKWYAPDRPAGTNIITESAVDAAVESAVVGKSTRNIFEAVPGCPRDLGATEAGAYVFDESGNNLAGFDFKAPIHPFEVVSLNGERLIILPEGGGKTTTNPAITQLKLRSLLVEPYPAMDELEPKKTTEEILRLVNNQIDRSDITYLPVKEEVEDDGEFDEAYVQAIQNEIEALIKRRSKDPQNRNPQNTGASDFDGIFVHIRTPSYSSEQLAEQQRRREAKLKKTLDDIQRKIDVVINAVSSGDEIPACIQDSPACWSVNRGVSIYTK